MLNDEARRGDAVDFIAFVKQKPGKIEAVLASHVGDERMLVHN